MHAHKDELKAGDISKGTISFSSGLSLVVILRNWILMNYSLISVVISVLVVFIVVFVSQRNKKG